MICANYDFTFTCNSTCVSQVKGLILQMFSGLHLQPFGVVLNPSVTMAKNSVSFCYDLTGSSPFFLQISPLIVKGFTFAVFWLALHLIYQWFKV